MSSFSALKKKSFNIFVFSYLVIQLVLLFLICGIISKIIPIDFYFEPNLYFYLNIFCIILSSVVLLSFSRQDNNNNVNKCFVLLGIAISFSLVADMYAWIFDGATNHRIESIVFLTIYVILTNITAYVFWLFIKNAYDKKGIIFKNFEKNLVVIFLFIGVIIALANAFSGFGIYIDEKGEACDNLPYAIILYIPSLIITFMILIAIIKIKVSIYERVILLLYINVPLIAYFLSIFGYFDSNLYYPLEFITYIFLFCNLMVERERQNLQNEIKLAGNKKELEIAYNIQNDMVPKNFVDYTKYGVDISAYMEPAKEVGGDFYDYFMIDKNKLAIIIADVSGKGVPASLFMVIGKILLSKAIKDIKSIPEALSSVHKSIIESNDRGMFITLFAGIIDLENNTLTYTNAGHFPPLFKKNGNTFEFLEDIHGTFLGCKVFENIDYKQTTINFEKDDILFLYTDGVTEAENNKGELYGNTNLQNCLNKIDRQSSSKEIIANINESIRHFVGDYEQSDDTTILCIKRT